MARKKKQTTDPPPENVDNTDDTFGLPEVNYQPLKRDEPEKIEEPEKTEEPVAPEEPVQPEAPPEVVVINETSPITPEPPPSPPVETPAFQFKDEPVHEETTRENIFEEHNTYQEDHQPYQPTYSYERESPEIWPKVLGVILVLLLIGVGIWYFGFFRPDQLAREEQERKELAAIQEEARRNEEERRAALKRAEEERQKAATTPAVTTPAAGTIETLSGRSGRYYVVIASSIDGDLIMDYAKKLSAKGVGTKIIPPFGKSSFHRLAVAEGETYETTQATADEMKGGDYGNNLWVVKY
jgi:hypothetical protein